MTRIPDISCDWKGSLGLADDLKKLKCMHMHVCILDRDITLEAEP